MLCVLSFVRIWNRFGSYNEEVLQYYSALTLGLIRFSSKNTIVTPRDISTQTFSSSFQSLFQSFLFLVQTSMVLCSVTLEWTLISYNA